jgi:hypothetical protein
VPASAVPQAPPRARLLPARPQQLPSHRQPRSTPSAGGPASFSPPCPGRAGGADSAQRLPPCRTLPSLGGLPGSTGGSCGQATGRPPVAANPARRTWVYKYGTAAVLYELARAVVPAGRPRRCRPVTGRSHAAGRTPRPGASPAGGGQPGAAAGGADRPQWLAVAARARAAARGRMPRGAAKARRRCALAGHPIRRSHAGEGPRPGRAFTARVTADRSSSATHGPTRVARHRVGVAECACRGSRECRGNGSNQPPDGLAWAVCSARCGARP